MHQFPDDPFAPARGYANTMIPADIDSSLPNLVRIALYNIDQFDKIPREDEKDEDVKKVLQQSGKTYREKFERGLAEIAMRKGWTPEQCKAIATLKKKCPPDRLYRIKGGFHSLQRGLAPLGVIKSYRPGTGGAPAEAGVMVLGFKDGDTGSAAKPFPVPAEGLEDVTEAARAGKLPELRHGGAGL
jgi:hypothetical protein